MSVAQFLRHARRLGWTAKPTNGGHVKLVHRDGAGPVFMAASPGDWRWYRNVLATMRRAVRPAAEKRP